MRLVVKIDSDNDAFNDDAGGRHEASRILSDLAQRARP